MRMFDSVVIACDQWSLDIGSAIRASLELFRLRVHFYFCVQKQNVLDMLAGKVPPSDYVVLCTHGIDTEKIDVASPDTHQAGFQVVDLIDGEWKTTWFALTPANVPDYVSLAGRTILSGGCSSGREPLARAFLESGCRAYIGPAEDVDQDAGALFSIGFFYHLLSRDRDPEVGCTDREAAERASRFDTHARSGTHLFRYYEGLHRPS
jgi:hypothetical protein